MRLDRSYAAVTTAVTAAVAAARAERDDDGAAQRHCTVHA